MDSVLAIDLGATKFAAAVVDETGDVSGLRQVDVDHGADEEGVWEQLADLVDDVRSAAVESGVRPVACGVGSAGPIVHNLERVSPLNLPAWRDFPLHDRLVEHTGMRVAGDCDTKALALGEAWLGSARGHSNFVAMVVSTGIGGGIVVDGQLLDGSTGNAGHIGHMIVVPDGRECSCGAKGCLEAEASGWAIAEMTGLPPEEATAAVMERTGRLVGRGVASVMNLLEVELAVVAGSVALGFGEAFFEAAQTELEASCRLGGGALQPAIVPSVLGHSAPIIGAGAVAWRSLGRLPLDGG